MNNTSTPFFIQQLSKFTYPQKFLIVCLFFGFSMIFSSFFLVRTQYREIVTKKNELRSLNYHREINKLIENLVQHEILAHHYLLGDLSLKNETQNMQTQILEQFLAFEEIDKNLMNENGESNQEKIGYNLKTLIGRWKNLSSQVLEKTIQENLQIHYMLIKDLTIHAGEITNNSSLVLASEPDTYYLASLLVSLLPQAEVDIPQMIILSELLYKAKSSHRDIATKLASFSYILNANLDKVKLSYKEIKQIDNPQEDITKAFNTYVSTVQDLTQAVYEDIVEPLEVKEPIQPIEELGTKALTATFPLWYKTSNLMEQILRDKLWIIKQELFYMMAITLFGSALGLLLGFIIMKQISQPLTKLIKAAQRLAEGDLSVRVPVDTSDEVGQVSEAFNQMVESLQELIGRLQWTGIQLTTSTTEISAAAKQQESSVVEQEATTKQIAVTAKEISTTAKDFARTMSDVSITAEQTSSLASAGKAGLSQMEEIMGQMVEASKNIASKLAVLSEKAGNITSVITTITKVADQTNLLSLNAAIEAEKAGEHGRSFSVIAKEIRRLADQTANATLDIEKMVNEIVSAVSAGVMGVDKFSEVIHSGVSQASLVGGQLTKIIVQVQMLTKSFENVNQGMQAQSLGAEQINESISQLSDTARQTTESILHFHKAIEELNNAAQEMQAAVSKIKR